MFFWNKICAVAIIFLFSHYCACAQNSQKTVNINLVTSITIASNTPDSLLLFSASNINLSGINHVVEMIPANYSTCKFGFFCKQEIVVEKATKIPFRFRLGSLQQCNFYEGKR